MCQAGSSILVVLRICLETLGQQLMTNQTRPIAVTPKCAEVDSESLAQCLVRLEGLNERTASPASPVPVDFEHWWTGTLERDFFFVGGAYTARDAATMAFALPACVYIHIRLRGESRCRIPGGPDHSSAEPEIQIWSVPAPALKIVEQPSRRPTRFIAFTMTPEAFKHLIGSHGVDLSETSQSPASLITIPLLPAVRTALEAAFNVTLSERPLGLYRKGKAMEALALLTQSFKDTPAFMWRQAPVIHAADIEKIRYAALRLRTQPDASWTLSSIAREAGLNPNKLKAGFRRVFGATVFEYLRQARLETALMLVQSTDLGMAQIAYRVGFSSPSHFTHLFHQRFKATPTAYRLQLERTGCADPVAP